MFWTTQFVNDFTSENVAETLFVIHHTVANLLNENGVLVLTVPHANGKLALNLNKDNKREKAFASPHTIFLFRSFFLRLIIKPWNKHSFFFNGTVYFNFPQAKQQVVIFMLAYQYHERLKYLPVLIGNFSGSESVGGPSGKKKKRHLSWFLKLIYLNIFWRVYSL